ncbi:MAG: hypothetical protein ACRDKI_05505 [Solirubrobacterales bacterium]
MIAARKGAVATIAAAAALLVLPQLATAASDITVQGLSASIQSDTAVVGPTTRRIVATVTLTGGGKPVAVTLQPTSPKFVRMLGSQLSGEGSTLRYVRTLAFTGAGEVFSSGSTGSNGNRCGYAVQRLVHGGGETYGGDRSFVVPVHGTVTLRIAFDVAGDTPWLGTDYAPGVRILRVKPWTNRTPEGSITRPEHTTTIRKSFRLSAPSPTVVGPIAARVDIASPNLKVTPFLPYGFYRESYILAKQGQPVTLSGSLWPPEPGKTISFEVGRVNNRPPYNKIAMPGEIAPVVTDAAGHFETVWTPTAGRGGYEVAPAYAAQPGDLAADTMCPTDVFVAKK